MHEFKCLIFQDHSDEREDAGLSGEGDDELFRLKPQFQGPKGAEVMKGL